MRRGPRVALGLVAAAAIAAAITGCGLGAGPGTGRASLTITQSFGSKQIGSTTTAHVPGSETVMRMLERRFNVSTRYGGGFVESINGHSGTSLRNDWFYYVNGIEATSGAATTTVHHGDRVWWDLHDWTVTDTVPAVVGSFPEPFLNGTGGKRYPVTLECANDVQAACERVGSELKAVGVPSAPQLLGTGSGTDSIAVVVGTWADVRGEIAGALIGNGPKTSGVYVRFVNGALQLLNPRGQTVRTLRTGAGLIAATSENQSAPTWLVTGTDAAGVNAAAHELTPAALHDHFALAVQGGVGIPVPLEAGT
ncbi:MAG TPA: DUF4430 domain-containing protein [Solirubrobacteraceae bacterium]|nr:DUF4430 domain-containing protein [Solirubrobacteraceae bacterium]